MNRIKQFGAVLTVATMFAASTFADDRHRNGSGDWRGDGRREARRDDRRNDRGRYDRRDLSAQGRITNVHRERDGYRLQLDRGNQWYYVPSSAWRSRGRNFDLRIGVSIRLGGGYYDDRGYIHCGDVWIDDDYGRRDGYRGGTRNAWLTGTVQRVDYRRDVVEIRETRSGRHITVDMRRADRRGQRGRGVDVNDLRRGDYVELSGDWVRGNVFEADRIASVGSRRY